MVSPEDTLTIDTYNFLPPNWRVSFTFLLTQFSQSLCKLVGNAQLPNAQGVYLDGYYALRVATVFVTSDFIYFQSPINNKFDDGMQWPVSLQINKVFKLIDVTVL
jgi:hypothetical protein